MTTQQTILVQKTWKLFRDINPQVIGDVFYSRLFTQMPALKRMFKGPMPVQQKKLVDTISMIVGRLNEPDTLKKEIREMGKRHAGYGVLPPHYKLAGDALLWTLEQGLGRDWTTEVNDAWACCYKMMADNMIEGSAG